MHALVQEQVPAVGGIGLVHQPETVTVAESIDELWDRVGEKPRGAEPLAIDDEAAERPPRGQRFRCEPIVAAPRRERLVEDPRQIVHAVTVTGRPVGGQNQMGGFEHAKPGPSRRRRKRLHRHDVVGLGHGSRQRRDGDGTLSGDHDEVESTHSSQFTQPPPNRQGELQRGGGS